MRKLLIIFITATAVYATDYWPPEKIEAEDYGAVNLFFPPGTQAYQYYDAMERFTMACDFIAMFQETDPEHPSYGGIREGESTYYWEVIQTDNTSESVYVWSRLLEMTGDHRLDEYIARSWVYILNNPAWLEEGGIGYYRVYNCGWGLRAERTYRRVTGDDTYRWYGEECASWLIDNPVNNTSYNNGFCNAWAYANLYEYGIDIGDSDMQDMAISRAAEVKAWAEEDPEFRIGKWSWAMSGGAVVWGLDSSYFMEYPEERTDWMTTYAAYMPETASATGAWDNAWKNWFAWGHWTAYQATGNSVYWDKFKNIADFLVDSDDDDDGGIPPGDDGFEEDDHTWVTSYLAMMCMESIMSTDLNVELTYLGTAVQGNTVTVGWEIGLDAGLKGFNLYRDDLTDTSTGYEKINAELITGVSPYYYIDNTADYGGAYSYYLTAHDYQDNEQDLSDTTASATTQAFPKSYSMEQPYPNPGNSVINFVFTTPRKDDLTVKIYDIRGRCVTSLHDGPISGGPHTVSADLSHLASGVYICEMKGSGFEEARKFVIAR